MYVLIFPTAALSPLAFIFLIPVLWVLYDGDISLKRVFWMMWLTGFLGCIGKMYWLVYTMNHYGYIPLPLAVIVLILMCGVLGAFWGCGGLLIFSVRRYVKLPLLVLFPAGWVVIEWCLTWVLTGFPWDLLGNGLVNILPLVQFADIFGVYGISFVVVLGNVAILEVIRFIRKHRETFPIMETAVFAGLFFFLLGYGLWRIPNIEKQMANGRSVKIGVLQGNIDQLQKWQPGNRMSTFDIYMDLAKKAASKNPELIVMPETALPYWQQGEKELSAKIKSFAIETKTHFVVAYPMKIKKLDPQSKGKYNKYNSATLVSPEGKELGTVQKHKLVPFGEYLPMADLMIWLKNHVGLEKARLTAGFRPAEQYTKMEYPGGSFSIAICYEIIFPAMVRTIANQGTDFLVTITNDSWFGNTSAPHQHVDQVAMRAIELRRSFARAANTGVSCFVDPTGKVRRETPVYTRAYEVDTIQTMSGHSVYARIGDVFVYVILGFFGVLGGMAIFRKRK